MVRDVVSELLSVSTGRWNSTQGLSLGLAIAQNVCQLRGTLQIDSQLEQGTVVTLFSTCCHLIRGISITHPEFTDF